MTTKSVTVPKQTIQDRRKGDRRISPRIPVPQGVPLTAEVETPDRILRSVRCVNLSAHGALLDFGEGKCPQLDKDSKLAVILKLAGEVAKVPGCVRHRTESRIGLAFFLEGLEESHGDKQALAIILRTLERAIHRRTSSLLKMDEGIRPADSPSTPAKSSREENTPPPTTQPHTRTTDRRQQDRRRSPRIPLLQGIPLRAEIVTPDRILRTVRCVNLSSHGALLDFGTGRCPPLEVNAQVLVNLQIGSDAANIPGFVRHRTNNRLGVWFPFDEQPQLKEQEQALGLILRTLERAVARRSSR